MRNICKPIYYKGSLILKEVANVYLEIWKPNLVIVIRRFPRNRTSFIWNIFPNNVQFRRYLRGSIETRLKPCMYIK